MSDVQEVLLELLQLLLQLGLLLLLLLLLEAPLQFADQSLNLDALEEAHLGVCSGVGVGVGVGGGGGCYIEGGGILTVGTHASATAEGEHREPRWTHQHDARLLKGVLMWVWDQSWCLHTESAPLLHHPQMSCV